MLRISLSLMVWASKIFVANTIDQMEPSLGTYEVFHGLNYSVYVSFKSVSSLMSIGLLEYQCPQCAQCPPSLISLHIVDEPIDTSTTMSTKLVCRPIEDPLITPPFLLMILQHYSLRLHMNVSI